MKMSFYPKLAAGNMKKNARTYVPYMLTCIITVAMYYIVKSLSQNPGVKEMIGGGYLSELMFIGSHVVALFAVIFLFYTNSFLVKRRKKEFGVFNILGMEKRHLAWVLGWETAYLALGSLVLGLLLGIIMDKAMYLLVGKIIGGGVPLGFFVSARVIGQTVQIFAVIFLLICINAIRQVHVADPIALLQAGNAGEKEPSTRWLLALAGLVSVGGGYYIAVTVSDPVASLLLFFVAVVLVIIGTYLLFTAGSIALLKILRKNRKYYYRTRHFVSVSGMIYRMKQNAVGLANICVLSTMVLVMVSTTTSLMIGMEDVVRERYPADIMVYFKEDAPQGNQAYIEAIRALQRERGLAVKNEMAYLYLGLSASNEYKYEESHEIGVTSALDYMDELFLITLDDYNAVMKERKTLEEGEVMVYSNRTSYDLPVFKLLGREYRVAEKLDSFVGNGQYSANMSNTIYIVVPDREALLEIYDAQRELLGENARGIRQVYGFDMDADEEEQNAFYNDLLDCMAQNGISAVTEARAEAKSSFISLYGGLFFIGVFLGVLFVMATVLIIYYKQISEGYDDRERFSIMQKVGMSRDEVKSAIHSQVVTVFFLPLIVAGIHVTAAFPLISKLLVLMQLTNTKLFIACTGACFLVFAVMYVFVYNLTARTYYRIVSR
ncbi:ABC transporter permease [uncultured Acetatifactor sp.]|uniref:ABC transporter permease n=1 Tax=uncultured Acetatifactor sp. TaxID=1671927 RepID=UPI002623D0D7|nr:FtsX-like permease family protein [uncultured Acetatifactor sp.]